MGGEDGRVCVCVVSLDAPVALFTVTNTVKIRTQTVQVCVGVRKESDKAE